MGQADHAATDNGLLNARSTSVTTAGSKHGGIRRVKDKTHIKQMGQRGEGRSAVQDQP